VFEYLSNLLQVELHRLQEILEGEMISFNALLEERGLDAIKLPDQG
jgi:hypothetical protein